MTDEKNRGESREDRIKAELSKIIGSLPKLVGPGVDEFLQKFDSFALDYQLLGKDHSKVKAAQSNLASTYPNYFPEFFRGLEASTQSPRAPTWIKDGLGR